MTPLQAGWYAGDDVWRSTYGPAMNLAPNARRFDVSPAWQAWIGAEQSLALFAGLDLAEVWAHTVVDWAMRCAMRSASRSSTGRS